MLDKKKNYNYLEELEADIINKHGWKRSRKEHLQRIKRQLKTNLFSRNIVYGLNTWTSPSCKILGSILKMEP